MTTTGQRISLSSSLFCSPLLTGESNSVADRGAARCSTKKVLICLVSLTLCLSLYLSFSFLLVLSRHNNWSDNGVGIFDGPEVLRGGRSHLASHGKGDESRREIVVGWSLREEPVWWLEGTDDDWFERLYDFDYTGGSSLSKLHALRNLSVRNFYNPVCGRYRFNTTAMPDTSVIVTVQNEQPQLLSLTVHSILARTPPELLREIIVVDDNGVSPDIRSPDVNETEFEDVELLSPKVRIVRNHDREGCARSRVIGSKIATGTVLMFVDSHIEMTSATWLQHLLLPIMENPHTMSLQTIDIMADVGNHFYGHKPTRPHWGTISDSFMFDYQSRRFSLFEKKFEEQPSQRLPYETPFGPGSLFAIRRDEFFRLGGYDEGLHVWGGENTELALKIWMCGGRIVMVPCSRTGHMYRIHTSIYRHWPPNLPQALTDRLGLGMEGEWISEGEIKHNFSRIVLRNNIRVMSIWVGNHTARDGYYEFLFNSKQLPPEWKQFEDELHSCPAAKKQMKIKNRNNCKDFDWFDRHVFHRLLGQHHPWHPSHNRLVRCGSHRAANCSQCPRGKGRPWCNGECHWCDGFGEGERMSCVEKTVTCPAMGDTAVDGVNVIADGGDMFGGKEVQPMSNVGVNNDNEAAGVVESLPPGLENKDEKGSNRNRTNLTISVVLPCAFEHECFRRTALSVFETTPLEVLEEIVIVDDASEPPLEPLFPDASKYKVKVIRSNDVLGLIGAKHLGATVSRGDVLVFFDCHVKPAPDYWRPFVDAVQANYRRVVVPTITNLDVDRWEEYGRPRTGSGGGMSKCYLTFDGEFKWTTDSTSYVPIMSGGLLAISRRWFFEIGGYDSDMKGWGGENLDQSLRIWRCGGEIVSASDSFVAHMWRDGKHPARYEVKPWDSPKNRARAMKAHAGPWFDWKTLTFPEFRLHREDGGRFLDTSSITDPLSKMKCESFEWYLWRFSHIYRDAGVLPYEVFQLESLYGTYADTEVPLCLQLKGHERWNNAGAPNDKAIVAPCVETAEAGNVTSGTQWWHLSGRGKDDYCCNGLRVWNTDQCLNRGVITGVCDLKSDIEALLTTEGLLRVRGRCLSVNDKFSLKVSDCHGATKWKKRGAFEPPEYKLLNSTLQKLWRRKGV